MKHSIFFSSIMIVGLLFSSCKKSDNNNNTSYKQAAVSYQLQATNTSYNVANPNAATLVPTTIQWTSGFANPDVIKFDAKQDNLEVELTSKNNQQIDLMSSVGLTFGGFTLPAGTYNEITLKFDLDKNGTNPSFELNGQFTDSTVTLPVVFQIDQPIELQTDQSNVVISNDSSFTALTTLDLMDINSGITASMLLNAQLTNGTIMITSNSNRNMYNIIVTNLGAKRHHCEFEHHHF